ncbi:MAG TPA: HEAT repeat domain-containing protein [Bryobacteraceae bacterium]|nr:HEAT repeat domain-containing protein [Bryobacteraceae bacterium]
MMLRRGFGLLALTVATMFAQKFEFEIDTAKIEAAAAEAAMVAQRHKDFSGEIAHAMSIAKDAWSIDKANLAFQMKEMTKPFFYQGGNTGGGNLTADEELKVMAIDGLMESDSDRAIPLVDKLLQNPQASLRLRMRALQALGRSNSTKAREIVVRVAKDGSNPELQSRALQFLGSRDGAQNKALLNEIYSSAASVDVKRQVLRSWGGMDAKAEILKVAKSEPNVELRGAAINQLAGMRASAELAALYNAESSVEIRERLIRALAGSGDWQKLIEIAKTEKNEELRNRAIQHLGSVKSAEASAALVAMYSSVTEASTRNAILRALSHQQGNARQLIALARKETNPELKRAALQQLSRMKGDEVTTYLMELLEK